MNIYRDENGVLNIGQAIKTIAFLRNLAVTAEPDEISRGICSNLNKFFMNQNINCCGYYTVSNLALGFPNVVMSEEVVGKASAYPIDYVRGNLWEVGNERTQLCTHIADKLQSLIDGARK